MREVKLNLKKTVDDSYKLLIGQTVFGDLFKTELDRTHPDKVIVVMDSNLHKLYSDLFENEWKVPLSIAVFEAGEVHKNMRTIEKLADDLFAFGLDRKSLLVAFGGGVCGDMTGFLAAIYMRGIPFVQVPTSVLAMVDSSIGGKTGVDVPQGKNLIGAFYQPKSVILDVRFLQTLPEREWVNGFAEILKHGLIFDASYFELLEKHSIDSIRKDSDLLIQVIERSCQIKVSVVEQDEKEGGLRQILNFGHTIGHAIESAAEFRIPHGFSVALGMLAEGWIAQKRGWLSPSDLQRLVQVLKNYGLLDFMGNFLKLSDEVVLKAAISDKKNTAGSIRAVLLEAIGEVRTENGNYSQVLNTDEIKGALEFLRKD